MSIYQRGDTWWVQVWIGRKRIRRSTGKGATKSAAKRLERHLMEERDQGRLPVSTRRAPFARLWDLLENDYWRQGRKSLKRARYAWQQLARYFGGWKVQDIRALDLERYVTARREHGAAPATILYELSILRHGLTLAVDLGLLPARPKFPRIKPDNTRTGFFEREEVDTLLPLLPDYLRPVIRAAYHTGWRVASELLPMTWAQVDLDAGVIRLEPGTTKNGRGRSFPLEGALREVFTLQRALTDALQRETGRVVPWVFHHDGTPIRDFRAAWKTACRAAGLGGRIPHDLRRSAVRDLIRAGVSEGVAMELTGHRTRSVFERYNIKNEADLRDAVAKLASRQSPAARKVLPLRKTGTQ